MRRKEVSIQVVERTVFEKRELPTGERYECVEGCDEREGRLVGWRTESERVTYTMPIEDFLAAAERR